MNICIKVTQFVPFPNEIEGEGNSKKQLCDYALKAFPVAVIDKGIADSPFCYSTFFFNHTAE